MTSTPPGRNRRRRPVLIPVVAVLVTATVGLTAALGGFEDAPEAPKRLGKGARLDQGQMSTQFVDAVVRPGGNGIGVSGRRYLQIILEVTNQSDATISAQRMNDAFPTVRTDAKTLKPLGPTDITLRPQIVVSFARRTYTQLHPGVPETVVIAFELRQGEQAPKNVRLDATAFEWYKSFFYETYSWQTISEPAPPTADDIKQGETERYVPTVVAQVDLPVRVEAV